MTHSLCGYADLLRVMACDPSLLPVTAELLGYDYFPAPPVMETPEGGSQADYAAPTGPVVPSKVDVVVGHDWPEKADDSCFWQATRYWRFAPTIEVRPDVAGDIEQSWKDSPSCPIRHAIARWPELLPRLRKELQGSTLSSRVDVVKFVQMAARAETLTVIPRQKVRRWGPRVQLIVDRSQHLIPFRQDQREFYDHLKRIYGSKNVEFAEYDESRNRLRSSSSIRNAGYRFPDPHVPIIVLSDFGALSNDAARPLTCWLPWASQIVDRDAYAIAVVPCDPHCVHRAIRSSIRVLPWQTPAHYQRYRDGQRRRECVRLMLAALACTSLIEPGLLRAIRREVFMFTDASLESEVWADGQLDSRHLSAAALDPVIAKELLSRDFLQLTRSQRDRALAVIREWRHARGDEVWIGEIWKLDPDSRTLVPAADQRIAEQRLLWLISQYNDSAESLDVDGRAWVARATEALPDQVLARDRVFRDLYQRSHPEEEDRLLPGAHPSEAPPGDGHTICISQRGDRLEFSRAGVQSAAHGVIGSLESTNDWITCSGIRSAHDTFWKSGQPPSWASYWGRDKYGVFVDFEIDPGPSLAEGGHPLTEGGSVLTEGDATKIVQRLRWIPPGNFLMGSPEGEAGRYTDEGPQHEVTLTRGYWMFDTPVTQQLWQAVMGENPSNFQGEHRPVENVSWNDAQQFLSRLNERLGDTAFVLPTEAQWEYACRARTTTRYAFGDELTSKQARFSVSDEEGTSAVGSYDRNRWGMFDMHGNVLEWCQDYWADDYKSAAAIDPTGPSQGHLRVLRGGSWSDDALYVRSAYRDHCDPGRRLDGSGFRCAQVQGAAEPAEEDGLAAEPLAYPTNDGAAAALKIDSDVAQQTPIPSGPVIIVRSDVDSLELRKIPKPDWASAIGRDRYGLWAEFTFVRDTSGEEGDRATALQDQNLTTLSWDDLRSEAKWLGVPVKGNRKKLEAKVRQARSRVGQAPTSPEASRLSVVQRMRWIPPGRFLMGSPEGDEMAYGDEKPQHEVTLSHGYWLFDTPVTQQLWLAVMNKNPSRFPGSIRPVEQVSWQDCQTFLQQINGAIRDLNLALPTEAEWEYACRAGTTEATYAGPIEILGTCNAPVLDAIAWYGGNSGVEFDRDDGYDSSTWAEKEHDHKMAGTRKVAEKLPNRWGLFDMLGNVWEWCQDWYDGEAYKSTASTDPAGPAQGHFRVLRGGSWNYYAQSVRSAYRLHFDPGLRSVDFGFRCAQVQEI